MAVQWVSGSGANADFVTFTLVGFQQGTTNRQADYHSKRYKFPMTSFAAIKAIGSAYPFNLDIIFPLIPFVVSVTIVSEKPQRMPSFLTDTVEVRVYGSSEVSVVYLASTLEELPV